MSLLRKQLDISEFIDYISYSKQSNEQLAKRGMTKDGVDSYLRQVFSDIINSDASFRKVAVDVLFHQRFDTHEKEFHDRMKKVMVNEEQSPFITGFYAWMGFFEQITNHPSEIETSSGNLSQAKLKDLLYNNFVSTIRNVRSNRVKYLKWYQSGQQDSFNTLQYLEPHTGVRVTTNRSHTRITTNGDVEVLNMRGLYVTISPDFLDLDTAYILDIYNNIEWTPHLINEVRSMIREQRGSVRLSISNEELYRLSRGMSFSASSGNR